MKKMCISLFVALMFATAVSAQVKTYQKVCEDETMVVNASDCVDRQGQNYLLWVRYDYSSPKVCMKAAKRDVAYGKAVRAEVLYEFDDAVLTYRIISKKYFDKDRLLDIYIGLNDKSREHLLNYAQFLKDGDNHEDG